MAALYPVPFGRLVTRMWKELAQDSAIFDLPQKAFYRGKTTRDLSVRFHGRVASTPLGPAAGPHSQLAQNLVLSFLGGARIFELKTVQVNDQLVIPRPCIDASTVGYNVEWSQELTLEQSLEEYVKGSMLIEMLVHSGALGIPPEEARTIFDMSVGYDLAGIESERVRAFIVGMKDASAVVEKLRREIPDEHARYRDIPYTTRLSDTLTLSTFHGCPPAEIERITSHLLKEHGLHCIVKLNPTLLGPMEARRILHDVLGYPEKIPDEAFEKDTRWEEAALFVERLGTTAKNLGLGLGVKFSNTLIVLNHKSFFPASEKVMYLSGKPLHVLAMCLVGRFRAAFGDRYPISFSAGIDCGSFPEAVALGLVPVTVCTDLLRTGGYARMRHYFEDLEKRMAAANARTIAELERAGHGDEPIGEVRVANTRAYVDRLLKDPRYTHAANTKTPPKVGTKLSLFDCLTCDKCIPVCPNDANFTYPLPNVEIPVVKLHPVPGGGFRREDGEPLKLSKRHQIATYADLCNECGNCDVFCPEDGGPYVLKPRFFGSLVSFEESKDRVAHKGEDGVFVERRKAGDFVKGRFRGETFTVTWGEVGQRVAFSGPGFDVTFTEDAPEATIDGSAEATVDLTYFRILDWLRRGVLDAAGVNYVNA